MVEDTRSQASHQPPPVRFELETFGLVIMHAGARLAEYDETDLRRIQLEHVSYITSLKTAGHVLAAGAITGHSTFTGMGFVTGDPDELRALMDQDPAVQAGVDGYSIMSFMCPKGALAFPGAPGSKE